MVDRNIRKSLNDDIEKCKSEWKWRVIKDTLRMNEFFERK